MAHGFLYLVAILDVASRKVLAFRLSNTLTADFCVDALQEALAKFSTPEISTRTKGRNLPVTRGSRSSTTPVSPSAWMAKGAGSTTCLLSDSGAESNTMRSICTDMRMTPRPAPRSLDTSAFTTHDALTRPLSTKRPGRSTHTHEKSVLTGEATPFLAGHFQSTRERLAATDEFALVLHDTTQFSYERDDGRAIGKLGKSHIGTVSRPQYHTVVGVCSLRMAIPKTSV
jgi:hypothetical protein